MKPILKPKITVTDARVATIDIETGLRWFWYDGKGTTRLQMWVAQFSDEPMPRGGIVLPRILLETAQTYYRGLPVMDRREALMGLHKVFNDADLIVGHNVRDFDYKTINGEMLINDLPALQRVPMHDTLRDLHSVRGQSRSLGNLLPRVGAHTEKPHVHPEVWESAFNDYEPKALREVWKRCVDDVTGHFELHEALLNTGWLKDPKKGR